MIDNPDYSKSTIQLLVFQALKKWDTNPLFHLLFDKDCIVRSAVARELQIRGKEETFHNLKVLLEDRRAYVREISTFILGQLGTPRYPFKKQSIPLLTKMLKDSDSEVRAAAAAALGHLGSEQPIEDEAVCTLLLNRAIDTSVEVRVCVAYALSSLKYSKKIEQTLYQLCSDENEEVREWATLSLEILSERA